MAYSCFPNDWHIGNGILVGIMELLFFAKMVLHDTLRWVLENI
jgi:hypothetical protein